MRFGGHIVAVACAVFFAGAAAGQKSDLPAAPAPQQEQPNQPGAQDQIDNPQAAGDAEQQREKTSNPKTKSNPLDQQTPTAEQEYEKRIRQYDPLAPQSQPAQGAAASSNQSNSTPAGAASGAANVPGPAVVEGDLASQSSPDYSGPAVLSRSYTLTSPSVPSNERWIPYVGINGIYDSGLAGVVNADGQPTTEGTLGAEVAFGISGRHMLHHNFFGLDYRGDMIFYSRAKEFNGSNQLLDLNYTHQFSRRLTATLVEAGSMYSQSYSLVNPAAASNTSVSAVNLSTTPNVQPFDNGMKQFTSGADVTYLKSARLSFNAGGSWFIVHRNADYLLGSTGMEARADGMYRLTRRTTLGVAYSYDQYSYPHGAGRAEFNSLNGVYSWALSSSLQLRARVGASHLSSMGIAALNLGGPLAALFGANAVNIEFRNAQWVSSYSAELVKNFRHGRAASVSYNRGISPGNGVVLTSLDQNATASASFVVGRRYYASVGTGYDSLTAVAQSIANYNSYFAFAGLSRQLTRDVQSNLRLDYRHYVVIGSPLLVNEFRVMLGFSWQPSSEGLFHLW